MLTFEKFLGPSNLNTISRGFETFRFQLIQPSARKKGARKKLSNEIRIHFFFVFVLNGKSFLFLFENEFFINNFIGWQLIYISMRLKIMLYVIKTDFIKTKRRYQPFYNEGKEDHKTNI
jgi:hypothetical protein